MVTVLVVSFNIYLTFQIFDFYFLEEDNSFRTLRVLRRLFLILTLASINFYILDFILPYFYTNNKDVNDPKI